MPNDMSPFPASDLAATLTARTQRYCARASALAVDPALTQVGAVNALDHLSSLQEDIRATRLHQSAAIRAERRQMEAPFKTLETDLANARSALSEALLRAAPDPTSGYGSVAQKTVCTTPDGPSTDVSLTSGAPQAVSASRALLDLEALRPYLSDTALRDALERYTKDGGNHDVAGVAYAVLPASAQLPCAIY
ncbi:hypothetical protein Jann_3605 [Jannaschia sp. CCS1]|nr:hypothetical protein Jann_3605 [Jannaschia sp. CCS1]